MRVDMIKAAADPFVAYGDLNLFCTCPPVEDTTGEASA